MDRPSRSSMRWTIVFMAFLGTTINYIDRANLGVALPALKKEFGLTPGDVGPRSWARSSGPTRSFQLPSGWFVDKVGPRIAYTVAVVWWSIFTARDGHRARLHVDVRLPPAARRRRGARLPDERQGRLRVVPQERARLRDQHLRQRRARRHGGRAAALHAGSSRHCGWRTSFVITGVIGVVWAVVWYAIYRHPSEHPRVSDAERAYILAGQAGATGRGPAAPRCRGAACSGTGRSGG